MNLLSPSILLLSLGVACLVVVTVLGGYDKRGPNEVSNIPYTTGKKPRPVDHFYAAGLAFLVLSLLSHL